MRIDKLTIKNFKCFDKREFVFNNKFNALIGDNGKGKSAILDALSIATGSYFLGIDETESRGIYNNEIRRVNHKYSIELKLPSEIDAHGNFAEKEVIWKRTLNKPRSTTRRNEAKKITEIARKHSEQVRDNQQIILPLIAYYGTSRLWKEKRTPDVSFTKSSRFSGYKNCLQPASNSKMLLDWFKTMEISILQKEGHEKSSLESVKNAVAKCIEGWDGVYFDVREDDLMGYKGKDKSEFLPYKMLSDGQRNIIGLIADMAIRCVTLNPHLEEKANYETNGIVLIDELDLHLHPNWQKRIVDDLKNTFPKIQFFVTTHSPFVVQSLKNDELINLDADHNIDYYKYSIEEISEVMGVKDVERSRKFIEMTKTAEEYFNLIKKGKSAKTHKEVADIKKQLDKLIIPFSDDPAYSALLKIQRLTNLKNK